MDPNDTIRPRMSDAPSQPPSSRLAALAAMVEADPSDAFCLYGLAQEYAKLGRSDESLDAFDRCLAADPNYLYAYFHKARVLEESARIAEAVAALREGLTRANALGDAHAAAEIGGFLDELS